jgi:hypothetical protein
MAGSLLYTTETETKNREIALNSVLTQKALSQGIVDSPTEVVVRDVLPMTDMGGSTTGATSATSGYRYDEWRIDMRSFQRDGSTAVVTGGYNEAVNVNLNKEKVVGFIGAKKNGEDAVAAIKFSLGSGAKIKDIWQIGHATENGSMYADNPILFNSTNTMKIEYLLKSPAIVYLMLLGKIAEAKGDTILGAE